MTDIEEIPELPEPLYQREYELSKEVQNTKQLIRNFAFTRIEDIPLSVLIALAKATEMIGDVLIHHPRIQVAAHPATFVFKTAPNGSLVDGYPALTHPRRMATTILEPTFMLHPDEIDAMASKMANDVIDFYLRMLDGTPGLYVSLYVPVYATRVEHDGLKMFGLITRYAKHNFS